MYLKLGKITKQVGLKGELKIQSSTNLPERRFKIGNKIFILLNEEYKEFEISSFRKLNNEFFVISFLNYNSIDLTSDFLNKEIYVLKNKNDLNKNEFFYVDLIDCEIIFENKNVGKVISIEEFPAQLTLKIKSENKNDFFIPFIPQFIKNVDIENKKIEVNLIEGML